MTTFTDNMSLELPTVSVTLGPTYAQLLNALLEVIDAHDHSDGKGVLVSQVGINITGTLELNSQKLTEALALALVQQGAAVTATTGSLQRVGTNLYWVNGSGTAVQITSGSSVVSSGSGALAVSVPGSYPYTVVSGDSEAVLIVDSSSGARTLNLPAATTTMTVYVKDGDGEAATNNITIAPDGTDLIDAANASYIIQENFGCRGFISDGASKWYVI